MKASDLNISSIKYNFHPSHQEATVRIYNDFRGIPDYWRRLIRWAAQPFPDISILHVEHTTRPLGMKDYHFEFDGIDKTWSQIRPKYIRVGDTWQDWSDCQIKSIGRIDGEDSRRG